MQTVGASLLLARIEAKSKRFAKENPSSRFYIEILIAINTMRQLCLEHMACYKMMHRHSDPYEWANRSRHERVTESPCVHNRWKPKVPRDTLLATRNYDMFDLTQMIRSYHMRVETSVSIGITSGILNETSNKAKIKRDIDETETINIELEYSVAKLLTQNEHLNKENETLKKHYKDLYDSIKLTRVKTIEQTTSLITQNANLKAQIQEKVFAIAALKSEIRKSNENSVDTKHKISKPWFSSQVDVEKDLSKPVTQHYLPRGKESVFAKPTHMIASSSSRNSSKNMPRFSSNDMVHNHYLDEARKKKQERDRKSKTSVMPSARFQSTIDDSKPKPRSTNHSTRSLLVSKSSCITIMVVPIADHSKNSNSFSDSKHFVCSTSHKCVFNASHDACITKILKDVNSRAKIQSNKTRNYNKPVEQKSHTQKPIRQIFTRHRFSPNMTSAVYEKTSPRSDLRWKPTGRIFKTVSLTWVPTGKILASFTSKDDSEPTHGSNVDIPNIHECKQTLDVSASTSINVQKEQSFDLNADTSYNVKKDNLRVWLLKKLISHKPVLKWIQN
ncbi:hypothetical protein Tco_0217840 [Tanacetum coccineum]